MSARITAIVARQVWDSRARPTVEAEVHLDSGMIGRGIAPAGASRGAHEAIDLRDGGTPFAGFGVERALTAIRDEVAAALKGMDARDQAAIDRALHDVDGQPQFAGIGGNASVAVSLAVLDAAAKHERVPTWRYLAGDTRPRIPVPEIQIFGGGAHAARRTDLQDFMVMAPHAGSFRRALEITADIYHAAGALMEAAGTRGGFADEGGWWPAFDSNEHALDTLVAAIERAGYRPGEDVWISLDIAANELGDGNGYRLGLDARALSPVEMGELVQSWAARYPILSIEDPAGQDDWEDGRRGHARDRRPRPDRRRRRAGDQRRARGGCGRPIDLQRRLDQGESGRHGQRRACRAGGGTRGRLGDRGVGAVGRDRRCRDRASRGRLGCRAVQGRVDGAWRAHREMERDAADRGGDGC